MQCLPIMFMWFISFHRYCLIHLCFMLPESLIPFYHPSYLCLPQTNFQRSHRLLKHFDCALTILFNFLIFLLMLIKKGETVENKNNPFQVLILTCLCLLCLSFHTPVNCICICVGIFCELNSFSLQKLFLLCFKRD